MKTLIQFLLCGTRPSWIVLACVIALNAGCRTAPPNGSAPSAQVQTLDTSLSALKAAFNRDTSKPRLLALFSPTCGGCIYGATALQHEARKVPGLAQQAEVLIVWVSMLETDNESEARKAAERFDFPGVQHFYDHKNYVGGLLMAEQFPNAILKALEILPADSPMRAKLESKKDLPPEKTPLWDSVLIFPPGVRWEDRSPKPAWWTRQTGSTVEVKAGGSMVVFWKNGRPVGSDWYPEAREALEIAAKLKNDSGPTLLIWRNPLTGAGSGSLLIRSVWSERSLPLWPRRVAFHFSAQLAACLGCAQFPSFVATVVLGFKQ